ncbi:uncharacterized protein BDV17DRAFT_262913, partial [Aspergillus undulatus]|uniref:uncharacterized protein n=1 Tax=Aspergillus undulatus TaxID=1810928 RepID=UPI003CCD23E3
MARAAVIPQSPPKRATRGRAKGTTTKTTGKQSASTRNTKAAETKKRNARAAVTHDADTTSEEDTDDEIGVIESNSRGRGAGSKTKSTTTMAGRGRKAAAVPEPDRSESDNDDDELARSGAPKKRAGRPKTKTQTAKGDSTTTKTAAAPKPRGRPKGTGASAKTTSEEDILRQNTRRNALSQDSDELSSPQQEPTQIFITTGSALLRGPAKTKKKVTFQELSDSDEGDLSEAPAPAARRRRGTIVAKDGDGMGSKPVRKAATGATRGRKPAAAKKGSTKPLSPKKDRQVAKAISAYASSDGEDDELNGEKDAIKLVVHSPQKRASGVSGLGSPVRRVNFTPNKSSKAFDENGEPNLPPAKAFDFGDSQFMASPARRPPPSSPFHFTLKETPKRGLSFHDNAKITRPEATPTQKSHLRTSPKKANLSTPKPGSLFGSHADGISQPNLAPAQNSPLKTSPRKGLFGSSFSSSQQPTQHDSTPFKSSLLLSPAKKVSTPFKSSMTHVPSSLAKETRPEAEADEEDDDDDETVSMYDESPSRGQVFEGATQFDGGEAEEVDGETEGVYDEPSSRLTPEGSPVAPEPEYSEEEEDAAQSDHSVDYNEKDDQVALSEEDEVSPVKNLSHAGDEEFADQEDEDMFEDEEADVEETGVQDPFNNDQNDEYESTTPKEAHQMESSPDKLQEDVFEDSPEAADDREEESDICISEERVASAPRYSFADGRDDVFTEGSPVRDVEEQNDVHSVNNNDDTSVSDGEEPFDFRPIVHEANDEPSEAASLHPVNDGPIQPYEIEEVEDTPFMSFLLTHWAPTLPCVDYEPTTPAPIFAERRSPRLSTPEDEQNDAPSSPFIPAGLEDKDSTPKAKEQPQQPSVASKGPRFTLLAEQFSQWSASSPAKPETQRPHRRGVFSIGRPSDVPSAASRVLCTDIFANAPTLSAAPRSQQHAPITQARDAFEDEEEEDPAVNDVESSPARSARSPMAEKMDDEAQATPEAPEVFEDGDDDEEEERAVSPVYPTLEPEEEKENEGISLPPATPARNPSLAAQTFHTVSKVPLKPEGEISPLKVSRKRGRSLSITSPVRSSPRLRNFTLPPKEPESPPRKSPRLSHGLSRKSVSRETLERPVEPQPSRARTPRSASPFKTPRKQVAAYNHHLRGAVVFVDVHTTEGEDASGIFIELLQSMGARCIRNWSWNPRMSVSPEESAASANGKVGITHVVFKDGGVRTLEKVRQAAGVVKCVGVGWVLDCEREGNWVDEAPYAVDSSIIPRGGAKRRKSMEPRALSNVNGTLVKTGMAGTPSSRRPSAAHGNMSRSTTPDDRSTPEDTRGQETSDYKFWQTPRTPGFNFDAIGMSPATPFYLNQRSKLVQQTCPPKQTRQGLFGKTPAKEGPSRELKAKLEAARRKSLAFKPAVGSPLV